eukprot:6208531-Pleurochrysis_carterae.AAC.3
MLQNETNYQSLPILLYVAIPSSLQCVRVEDADEIGRICRQGRSGSQRCQQGGSAAAEPRSRALGGTDKR